MKKESEERSRKDVMDSVSGQGQQSHGEGKGTPVAEQHSAFSLARNSKLGSDPFLVDHHVMMEFKKTSKYRKNKWRSRWKKTRVYRGLRGLAWFIKDKQLERTQEEPLATLQTTPQPSVSREGRSTGEICLEMGKNVAMVALTCSACYLVSQVDVYTHVPSYLLASDNEAMGLYPTVVEDYGGALPVAMMSISEREDGFIRQVGVQYQNQGNVDFYEACSQLLKESLGNMGQAEEIDFETFFSAVTSAPSLYVEYLGLIPFSLLESWLSQGVDSDLEGQASRLSLSLFGQGLGLYYENMGQYYVCPVAVLDENRLETVMTQLVGSAMGFAGQEEDLLSLSPFVLWGGQAVQTYVYGSSTPYERVEEVEGLVTALNFQVSSQYPTEDGIVVRSGTDSLRMSYDGTVLYVAEGVSRYLLPWVGDEISLSEQVEGCYRLLRLALEGLDTLPEISFSGVTQGEEGDELLLSFSYCLEGIPVVWDHERVGAEFRVKGEEVLGFSFQYRNYVVTEERVNTLPLAQVDAVLQGLDVVEGDVFFAYQDLGGESMWASWVMD